MSGPEDHPAWSKPSNNPDNRTHRTCVICKQDIQVWHCDALGCWWCNSCGQRAREKK